MICSRTPFCFVNFSAPFNRTEMVLYSKCAYGSQFSGEKNDLKIGYLVAEILSKKAVWMPCMHFQIFGGPKRQQFSWKTDNSVSIYHNFPIFFSIFTTVENYQFFIRGSVQAVKTVAFWGYFCVNYCPSTALML